MIYQGRVVVECIENEFHFMDKCSLCACVCVCAHTRMHVTFCVG